MTVSKGLYLAALILFIISAVLCFTSTDVSELHILGLIAAGLGCLAAAPLAA